MTRSAWLPYAAFAGVYFVVEGALEALVDVSNVGLAMRVPLGWMIAIAVAIVSVSAGLRSGRLRYLGLLCTSATIYAAIWLLILVLMRAISLRHGHPFDGLAVVQSTEDQMLRSFLQVVVVPLPVLLAIRRLRPTDSELTSA